MSTLEMSALEQQIEAAELDVIAKTRLARIAESELRLATVKRHDLHKQYQAAFFRSESLQERACP